MANILISDVKMTPNPVTARAGLYNTSGSGADRISLCFWLQGIRSGKAQSKRYKFSDTGCSSPGKRKQGAENLPHPCGAYAFAGLPEYTNGHRSVPVCKCESTSAEVIKSGD